MGQDLFKNLPSEIINDILSRLPIRTIAISKCVCKPWLDLLETDEFVKFHLSRSAAVIVVVTAEADSLRCSVFDLEDEIDVDRSHARRYNFYQRGSAHGVICVVKIKVNVDAVDECNQLTKFNFPHTVKIQGSTNGFLLLHKNYGNAEAMYVCNPISREYIELHCPQGFFNPREVAYGFGASKISGQYKVVCITNNSDCQVYTLGTGSWRPIEAPSASFRYYSCFSGTFVNGNLHWLVKDSNGTLCISCLDLETECFSTLFVTSIRPIPLGLSVLRDCLCVCMCDGDAFIIWLMKEYGDEKSWAKEYVINLKNLPYFAAYVDLYPIKVLKDGGILMVLNGRFLYYYSNKTKTIQKIGVFDGGNRYIDSMLLTPSFLSLSRVFQWRV